MGMGVAFLQVLPEVLLAIRQSNTLSDARRNQITA